MRTPREVGHAVRRDQQVAGNRGSVRASFRQSVLAEFAVHVAQFAEGHVVYDDVLSGAFDPDRSLQRRSLDAATNIRSCRISRASSSMMRPCRGGYCLDEEPQPATRGGLIRPVTADRTKVVLKVMSIDDVTLSDGEGSKERAQRRRYGRLRARRRTPAGRARCIDMGGSIFEVDGGRQPDRLVMNAAARIPAALPQHA
jgi:hypothetical protein